MNAKNSRHNIFSSDGHEWTINKNGQTRSCKKCLAIECCPPNWVRIPHETFSTEDFEGFIKKNSE